MHVAVDLLKIKNPYSGLGQFCLNLSKALVQAATKNIQLSFIIPEGSESLLPGMPVCYTVPSCDVLHLTHQESRLKPLQHNTRVLLTIHDLNFLIKYRNNFLKKQWKLFRMQQLLNRIHALTFISEFTKREVAEHFDIKTRQLRVIHNGCNPLDTANNILPGFLKDVPFIFTIGIVQPKKNIHTALPLLLSNPEIHYVIAGQLTDKGYQEQVNREAKQLGVSSRVHFLGAVNEATKAALYHQCEAFIFFSLSEGFGLPILEAFSAGKPVFAGRATSIPEIGGENAFYIDSFEANELQEAFTKGMKTFSEQPEMTERLKVHAANFSWKKAAEEYLTLYAAMFP